MARHLRSLWAIGLALSLVLSASTADAAGAWKLRGRGSVSGVVYPAGVEALGPLSKAAWNTQTTAGNTSTPTTTPIGSSCAGSGVQGCSSMDANEIYLVGAGTYTNADFDWGNRIVYVDGNGTFNFPNNKFGRSTAGILLLMIGTNSGAPTVNITNMTADYTNISDDRESGIQCAAGNVTITASRLVNAGRDFLSQYGTCNLTLTGNYLHGLGVAATPGTHLEFVHQHSGSGTFTATGNFFDGRATTIPAVSWTAFGYHEPNIANVTYSYNYNVMSGPPLQSDTTAGTYAMQQGTKPYISDGTFTNNAIVSGLNNYFSRDSNAKLIASGNVDLNTAAAVSILGGTGTAIPEVSVAPTLTAAAHQVGQTATCNTGTWTNNSGATYAYSWERSTNSGASYSELGVTTQTRAYQAADATNGNYRVRCTVRATNTAGIGQYWTGGQVVSP